MMTDKDDKRLEHILRRMREDTSVDAPADARKFAKDIFRTRAIAPQHSALRRIVAVLTMELSPNKPAFGERSSSGSAARQLLFEAGDAAIDLRIASNDKTFLVRGQMLGVEPAGWTATLAGAGREAAAEIGPDGGFRFDGVAGGEYELRLRSAEDEIVIEKMIVG